MNNLKKFTTEAEYSSATLNYPAVSWVTSGDTVHFDKTAPAPTVNDKVMIASYGGDGETNFVFYNCAASEAGDITSITLDDVAVNPIACQTIESIDASEVHIAKYTLNTTYISDWFSGNLGLTSASDHAYLDVLIPAQITSVGYLPSYVNNLVIEATTPPTIYELSSGYDCPIYVPDAAVNTYKSVYHDKSSDIYPISEYQGNLPL